MKISGIYQIQSKNKSHKIYIGSSNNVYKRKREHYGELRKGLHKNSKLQRHFNKYGESDLIFTLLLGCDANDLLKIEQYFIDTYKPFFNIQMNVSSTNLGRKFGEDVREKLRISHIGIKYSEESKIKRSIALKGRIPWNKGIPTSEECKKKQSLKLKGRTWEDIYGEEGAKKRRDKYIA